MPPVIGTSPQVGLRPYTPHQADGVRIEPPWSPPSAISTSPAATSAALPPDDPPALYAGSCGFRIGPVAHVWLPAEKHRSSHAALPATTAPASSTRVTTVASTSGTYPSSQREPFIIGTPATHMLSFTATRRPANTPAGAPRISVFQYHALSGFSCALGRWPASRAYRTGSVGSGSSSRRLYDATAPRMIPWKDAAAAGDSVMPKERAISISSRSVGGCTPIPTAAGSAAPRCASVSGRCDVLGIGSVQFSGRYLAHHELLDLPGHGHRKGVDHLEESGDLVVGDPALAEALEILERQPGPGLSFTQATT